MAEASGSRTQPPRVSGKRPILKTGRATGPHSLPHGRMIRAVPAAYRAKEKASRRRSFPSRMRG